MIMLLPCEGLCFTSDFMTRESQLRFHAEVLGKVTSRINM